ncbi:MAG: gamma-glutamyltransferase [Thermomicrobiales bacterium]|nr:gamma-glutamyltransferase [Thermomicrobiales bacterium]
MHPNTTTTLRISRDLAVGGQQMVAAKHEKAVQAGNDILDQGGNAVDAAVAVGFAIGVVEPWMSGIGGVGFMTIQKATGERAVVDYFGVAPAAAKPDMYELTAEFGHSVVGFGGVKGQENAYGPRSVAVPGMVRGMELALKTFGTKSMAEVTASAARFADEGFEVDWYRGMLLSSQQDTIKRDAETASIFLKDGKPPAPLFGEPAPTITQPDLANTLRAIGEQGADGFYTGEIAGKIASHMRATGGLITEADLAGYQAKIVEPLVIPYRDHELVLIPNQGGGVTIGAALRILDGFDLGATGFNTAATLHLISEASRRGYADRFAYVGDPAFVDIDWERLTSAAYAAERRAEIDHGRASRPGAGAGIGRTQANPAAVGADEGCTTSFSVVDREGNKITVTQTLTLIFGSVVTVPGTGILLNDSMNLFDPQPGSANEIRPGKRPASSMAHVVATRSGVPVLGVGAPGGRRIMDTCLQMTTDVIDFGLDIATACGAPLIDCAGPELLVDDRIPAATRDRLRALGHDVVDVPVSFSPRGFASPTGVTVDPVTGLRYGGADPFGMGIAAGR